MVLSTFVQTCRLSVCVYVCIYVSVCVLSLLLYGAECWVILQQDVRRLSAFYMACVRSILGVSKQDVMRLHLSNDHLLSL